MVEQEKKTRNEAHEKERQLAGALGVSETAHRVKIPTKEEICDDEDGEKEVPTVKKSREFFLRRGNVVKGGY